MSNEEDSKGGGETFIEVNRNRIFLFVFFVFFVFSNREK